MLNLKNLKGHCPDTLVKEEIIDYYQKNCKRESEFRIGLEYERVSINPDTLKNAPYDDLRQIIIHFAMIKGWGTLKDSSGTIVGAMLHQSSVSLEPGGQFEISLEPKKDIKEIEDEVRAIVTLLDSIGKIYDVKFLPVGITPYSTYQNIDIVKKDRYIVMADYLPKFGKEGKFAPVMMRETAGVQVNCDFKDEADALLKLSVSAKMSPFLTGFFANSPIRNNKRTNYKSFRALAWRYTDNSRCGLFYKNISALGFEGYVDAVLDVPMLFFERGEKKVTVNGEITFREFMLRGYSNYRAEFQDYLLHSSLCFPDIRLKNCLEIRNHDSQKIPMTMAVCAFYKGILYNENALLEAQKFLKGFSYKDIYEYGEKAARYGLDFSANGKCAFKIVEKLFKMSKEGLEGREKRYLDAPIKMISQKECMADLLLKNEVQDAQGVLNSMLGD